MTSGAHVGARHRRLRLSGPKEDPGCRGLGGVVHAEATAGDELPPLGRPFEALAPLIAALPMGEGLTLHTALREKGLVPKSESASNLRGIPGTLPPGEWQKFYERISAGASDARRDEVRRRWGEQDPAGWAEYLRDLSSNWAGWRSWGHDAPRPSVAQPEPMDKAAEVLGLSGDFGPDEIRRAWRLKSKSAHSDAGGSNEAFRRITQARDVLLRAVGMH